MDSLKLGLVGLSNAEVSLVQTLFRLHKVDLSFIWTLTAAPPFDALLVDAACKPADYQALKGKGTKLKFLGRMHDDDEGVMPRPIRSDLLLHWLNSIEVAILHGGHDQYASTASDPHSGGADAMQRISRLRWKVSSLLGVEVDDALDGFESGRCAFKLKRWPSPEVLQGDVNRIRIATLLSRKHLALKDVASLSRVPTERCSMVVRDLYKARLLESKDVGVVAVPAPAPALATETPGTNEVESEPLSSPSRPRGLGRPLIASIRKRFGIL